MIPERYAPITYSLFRIAFGFLFLCFGLQKVLGWFGGPAADLMTLQGAAGVIETVCGALILLGLATRAAAFLASGEMAVAFWYIHVYVIGLPAGLPGGLMPLNNRGVDSVLFCFAFLYIATRGSGDWSLDAILGKGSRR